MAVVLPHGVLFRKGSEGKMREAIISADLIEAVIGLGPNIFYGTQLATCILIIRTQKSADKRGKILFIDASHEYRAGRAQNYLDEIHISNMYSWYEGYSDKENISKIVTLKDIEANEYSLNIPLYIEQVNTEILPTMEQAKAAIKKTAEEVWEAEEAFKKQLKKFGLLV